MTKRNLTWKVQLKQLSYTVCSVQEGIYSTSASKEYFPRVRRGTVTPLDSSVFFFHITNKFEFWVGIQMFVEYISTITNKVLEFRVGIQIKFVRNKELLWN